MLAIRGPREIYAEFSVGGSGPLLVMAAGLSNGVTGMGFAATTGALTGVARAFTVGYGFGPFPPFARFSALQDHATVFGHARPAGLYATPLQQLGYNGVRCPLTAQFHDGIMERCQIAERNTAGMRLIFLHCLVQRFEIGRFGQRGWIHDWGESWLKL